MKKNLILYTFVAALGGLLFGFDTAVINGALPFFTSYFGLDSAMQGWAVSSALIGCIIGALFIGKPSDLFGRRDMLRVLAGLFFISALGSGLSNNLTSFVIFRLIGGIAIGGASVLSPMYISEIAPARFRGRLTLTFQMSVVIGILVAFFSDYLLLNTGENNWRWMFIAGIIPAIGFFVLLFFVKRSPRWLVQKGRIDEAIKVIREVNIEADCEQTISEIKESITLEKEGLNTSIFKKPYLKLIIIGFMVGMFNQFTGINIIMYYATDIFRAAGFSTDSAIGQTVAIGAVNLLFTILAMFFIDRIGRKRLLLIGSLGMTVFLGLFAYIFATDQQEGFFVLIALLGFIAFFAFTQGATIWVILSEMFPNNIRARGASIGSFSHWFFNAVFAFLYPILAGSLGVHIVFLFFTLATLGSFFFFKVYLIEMKGKSLEQLEKQTILGSH